MSFRLGYYLVQEGTLTVDQVDRACRRQQRLGDSLDTHLLALGWLDLPALRQVLLDAHASPEPKMSWLRKPMQEALESVPLALIEQFHVLPIARDDHALHLLGPDMGPPAEHIPLGYWLDCPIQVYPTPQLLLLEGIERLYGIPMPARFQRLHKQHTSPKLFAAPRGWQVEAQSPTEPASPKESPFVAPSQLASAPAQAPSMATPPPQEPAEKPTATKSETAPSTEETPASISKRPKETREAKETKEAKTPTATKAKPSSATTKAEKTEPTPAEADAASGVDAVDDADEVAATPPKEEEAPKKPASKGPAKGSKSSPPESDITTENKAPVLAEAGEKEGPRRRRIPKPEGGEENVPAAKMPPPRARMTPSPATRAPLTLPPLDRLRNAFRPKDGESEEADKETKGARSRPPSQSPESQPPKEATEAKEAKKPKETKRPKRPSQSTDPALPPQEAKAESATKKQTPDKSASWEDQTNTDSAHEDTKDDAQRASAGASDDNALPFPDTQPFGKTEGAKDSPQPAEAENAATSTTTPVSAGPPVATSRPVRVPLPTNQQDPHLTHQDVPKQLPTNTPAPPAPSVSSQFAAAPSITPSSPGIPLLAQDFHEAMTIPGLPAFPPLTPSPSQVTLVPGVSDANANGGQLAARINNITPPNGPAQEASAQLEQPLLDYLSTSMPQARQEKLEALLPNGGTLIPPILEHIPVTEQFNDKNPDTQERIERLVELCKGIGDPAVYRLLQILEKDEQSLRMRALLLLGEWLPSRAIAPLLQRLFTEKDAVIQRMIRNNLRGYRKRKEFLKLLQFLRDNLRSNDPHRLQKAIFFLGDLRIAEAVPDLIDLLRHDTSPVRESALFALRNLALQDHGNNVNQWKTWHQQFAHLDRKHWVVHALNHDEKAIRHLAKEELRVEFGDDFGYDPKAGTAEREAVQKLAGLWLQSN